MSKVFRVFEISHPFDSFLGCNSPSDCCRVKEKLWAFSAVGSSLPALLLMIVDEAKTPEHLQHTENLNYVCASLLEEPPLDLCVLFFDATYMTVDPQLLSKNVH